MSISRIPTPPLYDPSYDHDGCGTGFVANIDGERLRPRHFLRPHVPRFMMV